MSDRYEKIVSWLFSTRAIQVAQPDQPYWYTSGTLGPYYINTHFLYGDQDSACHLLEEIEKALAEPLFLPQRVAGLTQNQYQTNYIFRSLMDIIAASAVEYDFDVISGGERRDFFFSIQAARLLKKPHLSILKDGRSIISDKDFTETKWSSQNELRGLRVFHIADLVTEASSYIRTWIPVIRSLGCSIENTLSIVDRRQGGADVLESEGVSLTSLINIDDKLFEKAVENNLMTDSQREQITLFMQDPHLYMKTFLRNHPDFLQNQLQQGGKAAERAKLCLELGYGKAE
jgi:orotate phosphoribosyltransferase